jgi:hemoglobin-like flavoprotein
MDIQESIRRILERNELVADLFYRVFLEQYPEVRQHFAQVDMQRQGVLLTVALQLVVQYYLHSFPAVEAYLQILGQEHSRRGIASELYPKWRAALLATLSRFHGQEWDEALSRQWNEALELASDKMLTAYAPAPQKG